MTYPDGRTLATTYKTRETKSVRLRSVPEGKSKGEVRRGEVQALPGRGKPRIERTGADNPADDNAQRPFLFDFRDDESAPIWERALTLGESLE